MMSVLSSLVTDIWHYVWRASSHPRVSCEVHYLEKHTQQLVDHEGWVSVHRFPWFISMLWVSLSALTLLLGERKSILPAKICLCFIQSFSFGVLGTTCCNCFKERQSMNSECGSYVKDDSFSCLCAVKLIKYSISRVAFYRHRWLECGWMLSNIHAMLHRFSSFVRSLLEIRGNSWSAELRDGPCTLFSAV